MKKILLLSILSLFCQYNQVNGQTFSPIGTTGYNFDAVAEAVTASATTSGPIDGSNFVLYSVAYGALFSASAGIPNNGLIASGTRTYQLQSYTVNNMCYTTAGNTDSITFITPAAYAGLSILCFSTEGAGSMNVTVRFTDNTTQVFSNQNLIDWFGTGTAIISGFDRVSRSTGTPAGVSGNPKMFNLDFVISCANRSKNVQTIKFQNTATNARNCIMAVSGAATPNFTATTTAVNCAGGTNGSATISPTGGIAPFSYTWSTSPAQYAASAGTLSTGVYSYTAMDAALCAVNGSISISQSLVTQPNLSVTSNQYTVCAGSPISMTSAGAATYTWNTGTNGNSLSATPIVSTTYTVNGLSAFNCLLTGTVFIGVAALPVVTFTLPLTLCLNAPQILLNGSPTLGSGVYSGPGITFGTFFPNLAGVGSKTLTYTYTDGAGCTASVSNAIFINPLPNINFTVSNNPLCLNTPSLLLNATPFGGVYAGAGVTGTAFSPALAGAGNPTVSYTFTDANNCTATGISTVTINAIPTPFFQTGKKLFCSYNPSYVLNASPSGGTFSGVGISASGSFSPSVAGVGTHTITYSYTDGNNCTGSSVTSLTVSACTALEEINQTSDNLFLYPNPNKGTFSIITKKNSVILIINELGQVIRKYTLLENNPFEIKVSDLNPGIYFVVEQNSPTGVKQKVIVTQ